MTGPPAPREQRHRRRQGDRGAVLVEFAGLFPLVLLLVAVVWQCILIGYAFSLAGNAADEGARAGAAAGGDAGDCAAAATEALPGGWSADVECPEVDGVRQARVHLDVPAMFPGALNLPLTITGTAGAAEEGADR